MFCTVVHGIAIVRFSELLFTTNGLIMRAAPIGAFSAFAVATIVVSRWGDGLDREALNNALQEDRIHVTHGAVSRQCTALTPIRASFAYESAQTESPIKAYPATDREQSFGPTRQVTPVPAFSEYIK
jgi:hypothetical protein